MRNAIIAAIVPIVALCAVLLILFRRQPDDHISKIPMCAEQPPVPPDAEIVIKSPPPVVLTRIKL